MKIHCFDSGATQGSAPLDLVATISKYKMNDKMTGENTILGQLPKHCWFLVIAGTWGEDVKTLKFLLENVRPNQCTVVDKGYFWSSSQCSKYKVLLLPQNSEWQPSTHMGKIQYSKRALSNAYRVKVIYSVFDLCSSPPHTHTHTLMTHTPDPSLCFLVILQCDSNLETGNAYYVSTQNINMFTKHMLLCL